MKYDEFVGRVQSRARLGSMGDVVGAIRATLETLGERLQAGEAKDLASQLPREIGYYLFRGAIRVRGERFDYDEFVDRVAYRECVEPPQASYHSRAVMEVVGEAVSVGEMEDIVQQFPADFEPLFAGSSGNVRKPNRRAPREWNGAQQEEALRNRGDVAERREERSSRARSQRHYSGT